MILLYQSLPIAARQQKQQQQQQEEKDRFGNVWRLI